MSKELEARKLLAAKAFYATVITDDRGNVTSTREHMLAGLDHLSTVIKSQKWRDAVAMYAELIADTSHDLTWAYGQGSIWFAYAIH